MSKLYPGDRVRYVPLHAHGNPDHADCENGTVSSTNDHGIFVRFDTAIDRLGWEGATAQSCNPSDLVKIRKLRPVIYHCGICVCRARVAAFFRLKTASTCTFCRKRRGVGQP